MYLIRQSFKGTVVNRALPSLHEGLPEIIPTIPLRKQKQKYYKIYMTVPVFCWEVSRMIPGSGSTPSCIYVTGFSLQRFKRRVPVGEGAGPVHVRWAPIHLRPNGLQPTWGSRPRGVVAQSCRHCITRFQRYWNVTKFVSRGFVVQEFVK